MANEIFVDKAGISYLGRVEFVNNKLIYPNTFFLLGFDNSAISNALFSWLTSAGVTFDSIPPQTDFDNLAVPWILFRWTPRSDDEITANYRYRTRIKILNGQTSQGSFDNQLYADNGVTELFGADGSFNSIQGLSCVLNDYDHTGLQWVGNCDGESMNLFISSTDVANDRQNSLFIHQGIVDKPNPVVDPGEGPLFTKDIISQSVSLLGRNPESGFSPDGYGSNTDFGQIAGHHYLNGTVKNILTTGDANYPISCSDGQNPTSQWGNYYVSFLDDPVIGAPNDGIAIGVGRGLAYFTGTNYIIGQPFTINGSVLPDPPNASNWWMPCIRLQDKTICMRVHYIP